MMFVAVSICTRILSRQQWKLHHGIKKMFSIPPGHFTRRATAWLSLYGRWDQWVERPGSCKRLSGIWKVVTHVYTDPLKV